MRSDPRRRQRLATAGSRLATAAALAITACATAQIAAAALPQMAAAATVALPVGAATDAPQSDQLEATSCASAGNCVSVGWYTDSSNREQALLETESHGVWSAQKADLTALPGTWSNPYAYLDSVSCPSPGNCVAVGQYDDSSGDQQGLIETESGGRWSASELDTSALPSVFGDPSVELTSVSCPAAGRCIAVGQFSDAADRQQGLIASTSNGTWTTRQADLSALSPFVNPEVQLLQVSCASPGNCAAGGDYLDSSGDQQALLETESGGIWTAGKPDLSRLSVAADPGAEIDSVSCPVAGGCTAIGYYEDGSYTYGGLLVNQLHGAWRPATEEQLPANAAGETASQGDLYLTSVSCASAGDCTAVGTYDSTSANDVEGQELTETGGTWAPGVETNLPAPSSGNPDVWLASVSCANAGECVAAGTFTGSDGDNQALVARLSDGTWTTGSVEQPTTYNHYNGNGSSVSCTPDGYCAAGGYTLTGASPVHDSAMLLAAPALVGDLAVTPLGDTTAQVTWAAPPDNGGLPISGYLVTADDLSGHGHGDDDHVGSPQHWADGQRWCTGQSDQTVYVSDGTQATFRCLSPLDSYMFTVRATSLLGNGLSSSTAPVELASVNGHPWGWPPWFQAPTKPR